MSIGINDLPLAYQRQVFQKMQQKPSKYHNEPDTRGNLKFSSKKEARRFDELMLMLKAGKIRKFRLQVSYTLTEGYTTIEGVRVKPEQYRADFVYEALRGDRWAEIVEDAKGKRTQTFIDKKKQMFQKYGIEITEV